MLKISSILKTQKCKYCDNQATKNVIWADGRAYIPICNNTQCKNKAVKVITVDNMDEVSEIREK